MFRSLFSHFRVSLLLTLGFMAGLSSLHAQLDPKLQGSCADFLDLFQKSNTLKVKPEIVTVFDFSGSMGSIMYHPNFFNGDLTDGYAASDMKFSVALVSGKYVCTATLISNGWTMTAKSNSAANPLIRPDGTVLTAANIDANYIASVPALPGEGVTPKSADVRNWIRCLSHVRFTAGSPARTLDIPVPWTILDDPSVTPGPGEFRKMYNTYPLKMTILDPNTASPGNEYEMDTRYRISGNSLIKNTAGTLTSNTVNNSSGMYRGPYIAWLFGAAGAPYVPVASVAAAFKNGIPARSRASAIKDAAMRTWAKHYNKVLWAYRFLNDAGANLENSQGTTLYNDSRNVIPADPQTAVVIGGQQRGWYLLNKNSLVGLKRLAAYQCSSATPLTYAMGNTLAQLNDPNNIFNDVETTANDLKPVECMKHFLMLFTDGIPNSDGGGENTNSPYVSGVVYDANTGNGTIMGDTSTMNPGGNGTTNYWNIMNLAGAAAHLGDPALSNHMIPPAYPAAGTYSASGGTSGAAWLPYFIKERGAGADKITYDPGHPHPIYTMTVGVSLGGLVTNAGSPKRRMFLAAAFGDPKRTHEDDITTLVPFRLTNVSDPNSKDPKSVYFFDATDPKTLVDNLDQAFSEAGALSNVNATSSPNLPYVGGSLGKQVYLGKFRPPASGGAIWSGDLLMFATKEISGQTKLLDTAGNVATVLDSSTAQWSASDALNTNRLWSARNLFTRIPGASSLTKFSDLDPAYSVIKSSVATAVPLDSDKKQLIQFISGANTSGAYSGTPLRPNTNRNIMGDVINSGPAAIEYNWTQIQASGKLTPKLAAVGGNRFRLILVGTNQGWLHAFGEVTKVSTVIDSLGNSQEIVQGAVDELWSYIPTDFLANLDYMQNTANPHRFLVDGTPTLYHLDLPISGGPGNGVVDLSTPDGPERAIAIFGLRKGGRSYYALDIHDPFVPGLQWSLVPDEYATFPVAKTLIGGPSLATVQNVMKVMGYSTCTPGLGRVLFNTKLKDAVFLGGGYSVPEVEHNFPIYPPPAVQQTPLGRSVLAVDVYTGQVLAAVDLNSKASGPIATGVVPFEFILNSGMAQRAYFMDYKGGLWAWGSMETANTDPFKNYRMDSSDLAYWTTDSLSGGTTRSLSNGTNSNAGIRKVSQDGSAGNNKTYSNLPAPFRVGFFPGAAKTPASPAPAAVGIAMLSGDRNNPVDYCYTPTNPKPTGHRLTMVFDRQDSKDTLAGNMDTLGIQDANLMDFSSAGPPSVSFTKTTPGKPDYYLAPYTPGPTPTPLAPKFGYYINLPGAVSGGYVPKGINEPMVVAGSLFYSYFNPTAADPCSGGAGLTASQLVCDAINPVVLETRTSGPTKVSCVSGTQFTWSGVASNYIAFGTRGVIQAGVVPVSGTPPPGSSATTLELKTLLGKRQEQYPKVRVWRTVR